MSDNGVNVPLLRKAVEWAEVEAAKPRELREWEQGFYVLPVSADHPAVFCMDGSWIELERRAKAPECGTCYCVAGFVVASTQESFHYGGVAGLATEALGISGTDAERLFFGGNSIEDVRRIAEEIAGERL